MKSHKALLQKEHHVESIALFGSFATDEASADSDIDLLVEFEENTSNLSEIKKSIKELFKKQFNLEIDVCRQKFIKPYFRDAILESAIYV